MKKIYKNKIWQQVYENCINCLTEGIRKSDINKLNLTQHAFDCIYDRAKYNLKYNNY